MNPGGCLSTPDDELATLFDISEEEFAQIIEEIIDEEMKKKLASLETVKSGRERRAPRRLIEE